MSKGKDKNPIILQVLPELEMGGVEVGTYEIASELQKRGIKNFVASKGGRLEYDLNKIGVQHLTLPLKSKNPFTILRNAKKLEAFINENGINIVHARSRAPAWSAYFAAKRAGVHYMTTFHGTYGLGPWGLKKVYNKVMTFGERVIAISNHIKKHILDHYKIDENRIRLVHRCVNLERFSPEAVSQERMIKAIRDDNIPEDKPIILLVGRLTKWKGQHLLLEALSKLKNTNYHALIVGPDQGRIKYTNYLKDLVQKYNLASHVSFPGQRVDIPAYMMVSDIILTTSIEPEAFGRIAIEGQAMGKIVIASNIGGSLDTVTDGKTGKLYQYDSADALAQALDWALNMPLTEKKKIASEAIKNVRENFTKQIMCDKTIAVYEELLNLE